MKPWVIKSILSFDSMTELSVTIHWKAVKQYFTVMLFACNFGKFIKFVLGIVKSEM